MITYAFEKKKIYRLYLMNYGLEFNWFDSNSLTDSLDLKPSFAYHINIADRDSQLKEIAIYEID